MDDNRPFTVYNADKKEKLAIISNSKVLSMFLFGTNISYNKKKGIHTYATKKILMYNTLEDFPVAVRYSSNDDTKLLGSNAFVILVETKFKIA